MQKFNFNFFNKGQGALEYLIIIGAAILVAVIVVSLIISVSRSNNEQATESNEMYTNLIDNTIIPPMISSVDCNLTAVTFVIGTNSTQDLSGYCLHLNGVANISVAGCSTTATNPVSLLYGTTMSDGNVLRVSLIARRGTTGVDAVYSTPTMPSMSCTVHS